MKLKLPRTSPLYLPYLSQRLALQSVRVVGRVTLCLTVNAICQRGFRRNIDCSPNRVSNHCFLIIVLLFPCSLESTAMHDFYKKFGPHLLDDYQRVRSESHDTEALLYEEAKYIMERGKWMVMTSSSCGRPLFHFLSDTKMKAYLSQVGYQIMYGCSAFIDALEGEAHDVFFRSGRGLIQIPPCFVPAYIVDESLQPNFIRVLPYHIEGKTKSGLIIPLGRRTREQHAWYFHIPFCSIDTATEKYQSICRDVNATPSDGLHDDRCYLRIREAGNMNTTFT